MTMKSSIESLRDVLPPFFTRKKVCDTLGGLISPKTLANHDAADDGPSVKITMGRKVAYERESFLEWLDKRLQNKGH